MQVTKGTHTAQRSHYISRYTCRAINGLYRHAIGGIIKKVCRKAFASQTNKSLLCYERYTAEEPNR